MLSAEVVYLALLMTLNYIFDRLKGLLRYALPHGWGIQTLASINAGLRLYELLSSVEK